MVHRRINGGDLREQNRTEQVAILFNRAERFEQFGGPASKEHSCLIILKSMHWLRRKSRLKVFLFLALAAILFNGAERFEHFW